MFVVLVEFIAAEGHEAVLRNRLVRQAADSLANEADCHVFDVCADPGRPDRTVLYEVYTDRAAFDHHLTTSHFKGFDADIQNWVADKEVSFLSRLPAVD